MKPRQKRDRKQARLDFDRPIGLFSSLKMELSVLIVIATSIAFVLVWFLLKYGWSGWIAMPLTMIVALGITYFFSRGLIAPLRQLRDAAEAMSEGDYSVRVHVATNSNDEIGQLAARQRNGRGTAATPIQMRRDVVANVSPRAAHPRLRAAGDGGEHGGRGGRAHAGQS